MIRQRTRTRVKYSYSYGLSFYNLLLLFAAVGLLLLQKNSFFATSSTRFDLFVFSFALLLHFICCRRIT